MAKSKDTVIPFFPKDLSNQIMELKAASGADHTPGQIVVVDNATNLSILADADTALHTRLPKYMVWTDSSSRVDQEVYQLDGTLVQTETCISGQFKADVAVSLFSTAPSPGDYIVCSSTAGALDVVAVVPTDALTVIGRVEGDARKEPLRGSGNFVSCSFDLG